MTHIRNTFIELIGCVIFWYVAQTLIGVVVAQNYSQPIELVMISLSVGLGLVAGVVVAVGAGGEGHLNGAITLAMAASGQTSWLSLPMHLITQTLGFYVSVKLKMWTSGEQSAVVPLPAQGTIPLEVALYETLGMTLFVIAVVATGYLALGKWISVWVGGFLAFSVMIVAPVSGGAINPTLALGTQLAAGQTGGLQGGWWLYQIGPYLVAGLVSLLVKRLADKTEAAAQAA